MTTFEERLWTRIEKTDSCWLWTGHVNSAGYGNIWRDGREYRGHRVVYEVVVGAIPYGLTLDHLCRIRRCCNPAHLEPVTLRENIRRGEVGANHRNKTHCPKGHPYDDTNTGYTHNRSHAYRRCRACSRASAKARYVPRVTA